MIYKCSICGYEYDEEKEGKPFSELTACPVCKQPPEKFEAQGTPENTAAPAKSEDRPASVNIEGLKLDYPPEEGHM